MSVQLSGPLVSRQSRVSQNEKELTSTTFVGSKFPKITNSLKNSNRSTKAIFLTVPSKITAPSTHAPNLHLSSHYLHSHLPKLWSLRWLCVSYKFKMKRVASFLKLVHIHDIIGSSPYYMGNNHSTVIGHATTPHNITIFCQNGKGGIRLLVEAFFTGNPTQFSC